MDCFLPADLDMGPLAVIMRSVWGDLPVPMGTGNLGSPGIGLLDQMRSFVGNGQLGIGWIAEVLFLLIFMVIVTLSIRRHTDTFIVVAWAA